MNWKEKSEILIAMLNELGIRVYSVEPSRFGDKNVFHVTVPDTDETRIALLKNNNRIGDFTRIDVRFGGTESYHNRHPEYDYDRMSDLITIQYNMRLK